MEKLDPREFSFKPNPAVESKWREKKYTPEVQFDGQQYIVGPPCSDHDSAMEVARKKVEEMKTSMLLAGYEHVKHLPKAKE